MTGSYAVLGESFLRPEVQLPAKLGHEVAELRADTAEAENGRLRQSLAELRAQLGLRDRDLEQLKSDSRALKEAGRRAEDATAELTGRLEAQRQRLAALTEESARKDELLRRAESDLRRLKDREVELVGRVGSLEQQQKSALQDRNTDRLAAERLAASHAEADRLRREHEAALKERQARIGDLLLRLEEREADVRTLRRELETTRDRNDRIHTQHRGLQSDHNRLLVEFGQLKDASERRILRLGKDLAELRERLNASPRGPTPRPEPEPRLQQLAAEVAYAHQGASQTLQALREALTRALRSCALLSRAAASDPSAARLLDDIEEAEGQAVSLKAYIDVLQAVAPTA